MIVGILQARTSSARLPGKVLKPILGRPMLALQIERLKRSREIDRLVVATSYDEVDNPIEALAAALGVDCWRGSSDDVLDRIYKAALAFEAEHVVRLTGDCPLADPDVVDKVIRFYQDSDVHYASNAFEPSFPDGLDVEVIGFKPLETAWREAGLPSEREHVTLFITNRPECFRIAHYKLDNDLAAHRWTVDYPEDFEFVTRVYEALYPHNPAFGMQDVLALLEREPALIGINAHVARNDGLKTSLAREAKHESTP